MAVLVLACLLTAAAPPKASIASLEADLDAISKLIVANAERTSTAASIRDTIVSTVKRIWNSVTGGKVQRHEENVEVASERQCKIDEASCTATQCRSRTCANADLTCFSGNAQTCITSDWCRRAFAKNQPFKSFTSASKRIHRTTKNSKT